MGRVWAIVAVCWIIGSGCFNYARVSASQPSGTGCIQACRIDGGGEDAVFECSQRCPGVSNADDPCEEPTKQGTACVQANRFDAKATLILSAAAFFVVGFTYCAATRCGGGAE